MTRPSAMLHVIGKGKKRASNMHSAKPRIFIAGGFALVYGVAAVTLPEWTTPWWLFGGTAVLAWPILKFARSKYPQVKGWWWFVLIVSILWISITYAAERYFS